MCFLQTVVCPSSTATGSPHSHFATSGLVAMGFSLGSSFFITASLLTIALTVRFFGADFRTFFLIILRAQLFKLMRRSLAHGSHPTDAHFALERID